MQECPSPPSDSASRAGGAFVVLSPSADIGREHVSSRGAPDGLDAPPAHLPHPALELAHMDGDRLELLTGDREIGVIARVDIGTLEEFEKVILLGRAARKDIAQRR